MSRIILGIIHFIERQVDRRMLRDLYPSRLGGFRVSLVFGLLAIGLTVAIFVSGPIQSDFLAGLPGFSKTESKADAQSVVTQTQDTSQSPKLPEGAVVQDGALFHKCTARLSSKLIAKKYYNNSKIFKRDELANAIVASNPEAIRKDYCQPDTLVRIPEPLLKNLVNRPLGWPASTPVRAVYLQGGNVQPGRLSREVALMKSRDLNGIVFDVKDIIGVVNYRSNVEEVEKYRRHAPPIKNISKSIKYLHDNGIYVIARMALFQDENLATVRPELAIRDRNSADGRLKVKGKPLWVDPGRPEVQAYNLKIVDELIGMGVDEIQFDYVRYPAEGNLSGVSYYKITDPTQKTDNLVRFLSKAFARTRGTGVYTSIDIFGIVAWGEEVDIRATGQRISHLAPFVDIISPMLYPSHFNKGFDGYASPADEGYHFYNMGVRKVLERSKSNPKLVVRPWLQAFPWRVQNYNEDYIRQQILGNHVGGGRGWLMWNAGNRYDIVYNALRKGHPEGKDASSGTGLTTAE